MGCGGSGGSQPNKVAPADNSSAAQAPAAKPPGSGEKVEPKVVERAAYDADLRLHLLQHSTPHKVELTIKAAALLAARARLAQQVVAQRKAEKGCESSVALRDSPSAKEREEEELRAQMSREEKINDGLKLLQQRVEHVKVKVIHMEDDGNCQFRSLANELYGDQEQHAIVRAKVIAYLRANSDSYSFYVGDDSEWSAYLERMSKARAWGDELTLRGACDCYGCLVHVVTTEHENWLLNYVPASLEGKMQGGDGGVPPEGTRECFLAYVSPIHYNVIVPLSDPRQGSTSGY